MDKIKPVLCVILLIVLIEFTRCDGMKKCADGLAGTTPGYTYPSGDYIIEYGKELNITCVVDLSLAKGLNSSHIVFVYGSSDLPRNLTSIKNATAAELYIEKPHPHNQMYYCKLRNPETGEDTSVCMNFVAVATPPQDPDDFHCYSNNWENLTCEFHPKENYIQTNYTLKFSLGNRKTSINLCTNMRDDKIKRTKICFWDLNTTFPYRMVHEYYVFDLTMVNVFGRKVFKYNFSHYENVIPARPSFIEIRDKRQHSALVVWNVTRPMNTFPGGLEHMIKYISEYENITTQWKTADTSIIPKKSELQYKYELQDLKYAYALYEVRVQTKSAVAPNITNKWSEYKSVFFKTLPKIPSRPPNTVLSSFEAKNKLQTRDVLIYWQALEEYEKNGPDFKYVIQIKENGRLLSRQPDGIQNIYAHYIDLDFNKEYEFLIASSNVEGRSVNSSLVYVPRKDKIVNPPTLFTKISLSDYAYLLSWKRPANVEDISNYTIFWSLCGFERPVICKDTFEWHTVPANETTHNVTVKTNKNYQFAISLNTPTSSSGLKWAKCTVLETGVGKIDNVLHGTIGDTYAVVNWALECTELMGVITAFKVYYCALASPLGFCAGETKIKTIVPSEEFTSATLNGLKPYTTYQVNVSVVSNNKEGVPSDPLYLTTLEAAPTPPLNVAALSVTNDSITLSWDVPENINGVFKNYTITYRSKYGIREESLIDNITDRNITLHNLYGYTDYYIYVRACNNWCSNSSKELQVRTLVSYPGKMQLPHFNDTTFMLNWKPPDRPGGPIDYYEIQLTRKNGDKPTTVIYNTTKTEFKLPDDSCDKKSETSFSFLVRAVNKGPALQIYHGNWSDHYGSICFQGQIKNHSFVWISSIIGGVFVFTVMAYICRRLTKYFQDLKTIKIILPDGISNAIDKEKTYVPDETSLLPYKNAKLFSSNDHNTTFSSKASADDSGVHNRSEDIITDNWTNSNINKDHIVNTVIKLENIPSSPNDEWLSIDESDKKHLDNYLSNTGKYCLVGAETSTPNKPTNGYVQAVMPMQKPYESFECATLNPLMDSGQEKQDSTLSYTKLVPEKAAISGYLPITHLTDVEQPTRSLLSPNTPEDSQDDDDSMSQIHTSLKRSETSPGYVVVDAKPQKVQMPLRPVSASILTNAPIPKGYVKTAEIPTLCAPEVSKINLPYVTLGDINTDKKKLNNTSTISNGYVQHSINN